MAPGTATLRAACVIAALCAASLSGCQPPPRPGKAPEAAPKPAAAPQAPASAPIAATPLAPEAKLPAKPKPPAKKRPPKPKPAPEVAEPAPPPPPPPPNPEEERARKRDAYLAALSKATVSFNPPSPIQLQQRAAVALSVTPPAETAQLAEELRKSLDPGTVWTPRLRARLTGADFQIAAADAKDADGAKDLSPSGRTDWGWSVVPQAPGTKTLIASLSIALPPGLGGPRDLPALQRRVEVEPTLWWRVENAWSEYWQWIAGALVLVLAISWWARRR